MVSVIFHRMQLHRVKFDRVRLSCVCVQVGISALRRPSQESLSQRPAMPAASIVSACSALASIPSCKNSVQSLQISIHLSAIRLASSSSAGQHLYFRPIAVDQEQVQDRVDHESRSQDGVHLTNVCQAVNSCNVSLQSLGSCFADAFDVVRFRRDDPCQCVLQEATSVGASTAPFVEVRFIQCDSHCIPLRAIVAGVTVCTVPFFAQQLICRVECRPWSQRMPMLIWWE